MARRETGVDPTVFAMMGIGLLLAGTFAAAVPVLADKEAGSTIGTVRIVAAGAMVLLAMFLTRYIRRPREGDRTYEYVAMAVMLLIGVAFWLAMLGLLVFSGWYLIAERSETWITILSAAALCIFGLPLLSILLLERRSRQSTEEMYGLDVNPTDELAKRQCRQATGSLAQTTQSQAPSQTPPLAICRPAQVGRALLQSGRNGYSSRQRTRKAELMTRSGRRCDDRAVDSAR